MITYPIGAAAEKIVSVTIDVAGNLTPLVLRRGADGAMVDATDPRCRKVELVGPFDFVVRMSHDHSGVLEIGPSIGPAVRRQAIIPLGPDRPFLESELPPSAGADGAFSLGNEVRFTFATRTLRWTAENISGRLELTDRVTAVTVALRLPPGAQGELVFSAPLFPPTDGRCPCTLSAA